MTAFDGLRESWEEPPRRARRALEAVVEIAAWATVTIAAAALVIPALGADIAGAAHVIDGDTIVIAETHVRLAGIDAPELHQSCTDSAGATYLCGVTAAAALRKMIGERPVSCAPQGTDRYGRMLATCHVDDTNLNAAMVHAGWAVDYSRYSHGLYRADQDAAIAAHAGIWAGQFMPPEVWRHMRRQ